MMNRLFGTDGVRGIVGEELSAETALAIGMALGTVLRADRTQTRPRIIIGSDTRISSDLLTSAVASGLASMGCDCYNVGVVPTPAVAYITAHEGANAGVMISASHNPYRYNGIKIFNGDGFKLSDRLEDEIEALVSGKTLLSSCAECESLGRIFDGKHLVGDYVAYIKSTSAKPLDGLRIAIDCANGSASATAKAVFSDTGADITYLFDQPNGININKECGSTRLTSLSEYVTSRKLDCGIAFDGDADRCLAVDENGREVDGDFIMAILSLALRRRGALKRNTVVGTVMTNYGFSAFCEEQGINFLTARVGDRYVLEQMELHGYALGGEQSGHIILREYASTGDGQLTALHLLAELKESGMPLSELASCMKKYPQHTVNVEASTEQKSAFLTDAGIKAIIEDAEERLIGRGRIVARPSGTEPLVRIMIEDSDPELAESLCISVARSIRDRLGKYR